jgi:hypothetical protein
MVGSTASAGQTLAGLDSTGVGPREVPVPQLCSDITACAHTAGTNLRVSGGRYTGFH